MAPGSKAMNNMNKSCRGWTIGKHQALDGTWKRTITCHCKCYRLREGNPMGLKCGHVTWESEESIVEVMEGDDFFTLKSSSG